MYDRISQQIHSQTLQSIEVDKMTLYFKRGPGNHVYLLWMGEIHKKGNSNQGATMQRFFKTQNFKGDHTHRSDYKLDPIKVGTDHKKVSNVVTRYDSKSNIMRLHKVNSTCYMCLEARPSSHFVMATNDFIITLYESYRQFYRNKVLHKKSDFIESHDALSTDVQAFDQERDGIPNYFRNILAFVNFRVFSEQKENKGFLEEKNLICFDCYLRGTKKLDKQIEGVMMQSGAQMINETARKMVDSTSRKHFLATGASSKIRVRRIIKIANPSSFNTSASSRLKNSKDQAPLSSIASNTHCPQTPSTMESSSRMEKVYGVSKSMVTLPLAFVRLKTKILAKPH